MDLYPCQILFIHRDADKESWENRCTEIEWAVQAARGAGSLPRHVRVVPVRMTEAWMLADERALRGRLATRVAGRLWSCHRSRGWSSWLTPRPSGTQRCARRVDYLAGAGAALILAATPG